MGKESMEAEERYLTRRASGIGPGIILLKAKICTHHPPTMACSRFLANADNSGFSIKEEGPQLGGESREKGQNRVHLPTKGYIQIGIGQQTRAVKARGSLAPAELGTSTPPWHWGALLRIRPENQAAKTKTDTGQNRVTPRITSTRPLW